jgi:hypothetical protein
MKLEFIKLRGRPPKKININRNDMFVLNALGLIKIPGYFVTNNPVKALQTIKDCKLNKINPKIIEKLKAL